MTWDQHSQQLCMSAARCPRCQSRQPDHMQTALHVLNSQRQKPHMMSPLTVAVAIAAAAAAAQLDQTLVLLQHK